MSALLAITILVLIAVPGINSCIFSTWGSYSTCSRTCGGGVATSTRSVLLSSLYNPSLCSSTVQTKACNTFSCPVDCVLSAWSAFSTSCSATCGGGQVTRTRTVVTSPQFGGVACGALIESKACNTFSCPVDCVLSEWSAFSTSCSATCGGGQVTRTRTVVTSPQFGGVECDVLTESEACNTFSCPVDCVLSAWSAFSTSCSATCGGGQVTRTRTVVTSPQFGGVACGALIESKACNTFSCPVDCVLSAWSAFSTSCSATCGGGQVTRTRTVVTSPQFGGVACGALIESEACNTFSCPVDCVLSEWSAFSTSCSATCGGGQVTRTRTVVTSPQFGGVECDVLTESEACNTFSCPVDCVLSEWSEFCPTCSVTCGGGQVTRTRTVVTSPQFGGVACGALIESEACNTFSCPVDCVLSEWSAFSTSCSATCGGGQVTRTRTVVTSPQFGGVGCDVLIESEACNTFSCPVDCVLSEWSAICSTCSATCGGGLHSRSRTVVISPQFGGVTCGELTLTIACNTDPCPTTSTTTTMNPLDCVVSTWGAFGSCSVSCGGGVQTRTRTVLSAMKYGGMMCGALVDTQKCNVQSCASLGTWSAPTETNIQSSTFSTIVSTATLSTPRSTQNQQETTYATTTNGPFTTADPNSSDTKKREMTIYAIAGSIFGAVVIVAVVIIVRTRNNPRGQHSVLNSSTKSSEASKQIANPLYRGLRSEHGSMNFAQGFSSDHMAAFYQREFLDDDSHDRF